MIIIIFFLFFPPHGLIGVESKLRIMQLNFLFHFKMRQKQWGWSQSKLRKEESEVQGWKEP